MMQKITALLSDEESVRQLTELAGMLMSENSGDGKETETDKKEECEESSSVNIPDISAIVSLAGAMNRTDKNEELLYALKPHLSPERQKKTDKAVKMLKLFNVLKTAKESGLLSEII